MNISNPMRMELVRGLFVVFLVTIATAIGLGCTEQKQPETPQAQKQGCVGLGCEKKECIGLGCDGPKCIGMGCEDKQTKKDQLPGSP